MCLTYGRRQKLIDEALYSFLVQDYPGGKELLLLNDFSHQIIRFSHPEVTVVNLPVKFRTLGEKRNAAVALCRHDLLAVWDDDDIYLPHRLRFSVGMYDRQRRFFKPSRAFLFNDGRLSGPVSGGFHGGGMWHRSLFDEVGGYRHIGSGEDQDIERRFEEVIGREKSLDHIAPEDIFYLYRWRGTHSYHVSAFGKAPTDATGADKVVAYALKELEAGAIGSGILHLEPRWDADYVDLVNQYVKGVGSC